MFTGMVPKWRGREALTLFSHCVPGVVYFLSFNPCIIDPFTAEGGQPLYFLDLPLALRVGDGMGQVLQVFTGQSERARCFLWGWGDDNRAS